jgi:hypothetical protein
MPQGPYLAKYGASYTAHFELYEVDGVDFRADATFAAGDIKLMKDEGAEANTTNLPTDEGTGYSIVLTATEMQAAKLALYFVDQTATKVWLDTKLSIETYGNASAQHAFDLDAASTAQTGDSYAVVNSGTFGNAQLVRATTPANTLNVDVNNRAESLLGAVTHTGATVPNVTLVATTTTNSDMRGTDNAALAATAFNAATTPVEILTTGGTAGGTNAEELVDDVWDEPLTGATHNVATSSGRRLRGLQDFQTYFGHVWVDTVDGTAGTVAGENGTINNYVLTWADALTLEALAETPNKRFGFANGTSITPAATLAGYVMTGTGWDLAFNGQAIDSTFIEGAKVSGTATVVSDTTHAHLINCEFDTVTIGNIFCKNAIINATVNMANIGEYSFQSSASGVIGLGQPIYNFGALGVQDLALRDYDGSAELQNMAAGDNCSIDGIGRKIPVEPWLLPACLI